MPIARSVPVRLVLDTNTVISGLLWHGKPGELIDLALAGVVTLISAPSLLEELQGVLAREKFAQHLAARGQSATTIFDGYSTLVKLIKLAVIAPVILADPSDDQVLACALGGKADLIVSGDRHLRDLGGEYRGIRIVNAAAALELLGNPLRQV